jgi:hypothetical protein
VGPVPDPALWVLFPPYKQCCGSGIFIPDPGSRVKRSRIRFRIKVSGISYLSRIPDSGAKKTPDPGPDPQHCLQAAFLLEKLFALEIYHPFVFNFNMRFFVANPSFSEIWNLLDVAPLALLIY